MPTRTKTRPARTSTKGLIYLAPFVVLFLIFGLFPLLYTGYVSLTNASLNNPSAAKFISFDNYGKLLGDSYFWNAVGNTFTLGILAIGPQLIFALLIANLLNYKLKHALFWRVTILIPYATSVAAAALIFGRLYSENYGFVNNILVNMGLDPVNWQTGTFASQFAIASIVTWRWTGYNALIYLASMQTIPNELYEAAEVDGCSKARQFFHVTLPGVRGTILFTVIVSTIGAMQLFVEPLLFEGGPTGMQGGLSRQYQTLSLYMYQQGWSYNHLGYGSSIAFTTLLLILIVLGAGFLLQRAGRLASRAANTRKEMAR